MWMIHAFMQFHKAKTGTNFLSGNGATETVEHAQLKPYRYVELMETTVTRGNLGENEGLFGVQCNHAYEKVEVTKSEILPSECALAIETQCELQRRTATELLKM